MNATASVTILVNDQPREVGPGDTLAALVGRMGLAGRAGIAAAVNDGVVPRREWENRALAAGDRVLLIQAAQGG
jgi:sulfur carrier protein